MFKYLMEGSSNTLKAVAEIGDFSQALDNSWKAPRWCVWNYFDEESLKPTVEHDWEEEELSVMTTVSGCAVYLLIQGPEA